FHHDGPNRHKVVEAAWKSSSERAEILATMSAAEIKRRRYSLKLSLGFAGIFRLYFQ
ncbi:unnamed protein product, partial [Durusdinium trenchii]